MIYPNFSAYIGKEIDQKYVGFIAEHNFFFVLEAYVEAYTKDEGKQFLSAASAAVFEKDPQSLQEFSQLIDEVVQKSNLPVGFSGTAGYCKNSVFFLKTMGEGLIYLKRGTSFEKIIGGNNTASGFVKEGDVFALSTEYFMLAKSGYQILEKTLHHKKIPSELVEHIASHMKTQDDSGAIALFISFHEKIIDRGIEDVENKNNVLLASVEESVLSEKQEMAGDMQPAKKSLFVVPRLRLSKKKIGAGILALIFIVILINVIRLFGIKKESEFDVQKAKVQADIDTKLKEAVSLTDDSSNAIRLVAESRTEVNSLKQIKSLSKSNKETIQNLEKTIADTEKNILKVEEKQPVEYYDLSVEEKDAKGDKLSLFGDSLAVLNKAGRVYILSLEKKSMEKRLVPELVNADIIAAYEKGIYLYKQGAGIYKVEGKDAAKRVIANDTGWGEITDMQTYNGNIYALDSKNDEIYKYLVTENGFSDKISYFKSGESMDLSKAYTFAIDSAVYIGFDSFVSKYLSGVKEDFKLQMPTENIHIRKVLAQKDVDHIYLWDKEDGIVYSFAKDGSYEKQVVSPLLKTGDDMVVYKDAFYIVKGSKIYSL